MRLYEVLNTTYYLGSYLELRPGKIGSASSIWLPKRGWSESKSLAPMRGRCVAALVAGVARHSVSAGPRLTGHGA
jgi:hypothetical protein